MNRAPTCLIADDEPLLREELEGMLREAWPALEVVARARNGREAVALFEQLAPDICFLDVRMPGLSGVEAARRMSGRAQLVFVTAFDHYAVEAFNQGVIDYLVKPVSRERLAATVQRLRGRLDSSPPALPDDLLRQLAGQLQPATPPPRLAWLRASAGSTVRLIAIDAVDFFRSDEKYTRVGWRDETGAPQESVIRIPIKDLVPQLDPDRFVQSHRSVLVALRAIRLVVKGDNETALIHLSGRGETLPVSRKYVHQFRQM